MARPAQDAQIRINEILNVADQLFFSQGYQATTITDIAKKMGVAQGMLYYYFKSKEDVLEKLLDRHATAIISNMQEIIKMPLPPSEKIGLALSSMLRTVNYKDGLLLNMLYDTNNLHIKDKLFNHMEIALSPWLLKIIEDGIADQAFTILHSQTAVEYLLTITEFLGIALHRHSTSPPALAFRIKTSEALVEKVLGIAENTIHIRI